MNVFSRDLLIGVYPKVADMSARWADLPWCRQAGMRGWEGTIGTAPCWRGCCSSSQPMRKAGAPPCAPPLRAHCARPALLCNRACTRRSNT